MTELPTPHALLTADQERALAATIRALDDRPHSRPGGSPVLAALLSSLLACAPHAALLLAPVTRETGPLLPPFILGESPRCSC